MSLRDTRPHESGLNLSILVGAASGPRAFLALVHPARERICPDLDPALGRTRPCCPAFAVSTQSKLLHVSRSARGGTPTRSRTMDILHDRCAGLDLHKKTVVACIRAVDPDGHIRTRTRTFA